ncbi:hypothetical protein GGQ98_003634 [Sphingosinicella soli]|uniref:Uncharacterized protein n=1 Tax=Sphingosinicella soli TaxID=333708 RepID=A0A7W7B4S0_9SPHN|nr:hypothetical protein [Sphingosinicella soli]
MAIAAIHLHFKSHVGTTYKRALTRSNLARDRAVSLRFGLFTAYANDS